MVVKKKSAEKKIPYLAKRQVVPWPVKLISILYYLGAAWSFIIAILLIIFKQPILNFLDSAKLLPQVPGLEVTIVLSSVIFLVGIFGIIIGVLHFFIAMGLWQRKNWARITAIIISVFGVLGGLMSLPLGIFNLIINGLIIWYLGFSKEGKKVFGS